MYGWNLRSHSCKNSTHWLVKYVTHPIFSSTSDGFVFFWWNWSARRWIYNNKTWNLQAPFYMFLKFCDVGKHDDNTVPTLHLIHIVSSRNWWFSRGLFVIVGFWDFLPIYLFTTGFVVSRYQCAPRKKGTCVRPCLNQWSTEEGKYIISSIVINIITTI